MVATNPGCDPGLLAVMSTDPELQVILKTASNFATPATVLAVLALRHPIAAVRERAAKNPSCPQDTLAGMAQNSVWGIRLCVARNPNTPPATLAALTRSDEYAIAGHAAQNPICPKEALTPLLARNSDPHHDVVFAAENPNCDTATLAELAQHGLSPIREAVAENSNCPTRTLATLAEDSVPGVRWAVAANQRTLKVLADDSTAHGALAANANCDTATLDTLSRVGTASTRETVAANTSCDTATLFSLVKDTNEAVSTAALRTIATRVTNWTRD